MSGYVDLQVNGYAGVDFNADKISEAEAAEASRRLREDGNDSVLATIITAPTEVMTARIAHMADLIERVPEFGQTVVGIHIEGPFINPKDGFVGAHPPSAVVPATPKLAEQLCEAGRGLVRMFTLAPECDIGARVTSQLSSDGIVVAAGHSDATIDELRESLDHGLRLFTHLGNGCPSLLRRHDNIIQRVLSLSDQLMVSFIADGHHVPTFALKNYLDRVPDSNVVIVTDAISAAGLGAGRYELAGQIVEVDEDGAAWSQSREHFAGCATTFPRMVEILRTDVGATDEMIRRWLTDNPKRLLDQ